MDDYEGLSGPSESGDLPETVITFYQTGGWSQPVEAVEVERSSENSIWVNGRRRARMSSYEKYWDTEKEAWDHLVKEAAYRLESATADMDRASEMLDEVRAAIPEDLR